MATCRLTEKNFSQTLAGNRIVLLNFWRSWCTPCLQFRAIYEQLSEKYPDIVFGSIDTDDQQALAGAANISSVPTLIAIKDQTVAIRHSGALSSVALEQLIAQIYQLDVAKTSPTTTS